MAYLMNPAQFAQVSALPADQRYRHFIGKVADGEELWTLKGTDGFVLFEAGDGTRCVPVWPHQDYAESLATGDWADSAPERIDLDAFRSRWIPGMDNDARMVAVFPTPEAKGVVITPANLEADLSEELAQYE